MDVSQTTVAMYTTRLVRYFAENADLCDYASDLKEMIIIFCLFYSKPVIVGNPIEEIQDHNRFYDADNIRYM